MNREIEARLKISAVDKTGRTFKGIADKMGEVNRRAGEFNRRQSALASSTAAMYATVARYAAPAALAYGAKVALVDFAALERQMTRIGITADATSEQTSRAFTEAQKVSRDLNYDSVAPAIEALDTLVSSGKSLEEAMAFLPSVLATAQASGAATADIANTGLKAADALKIETSQLQRAFDIMVMGGKAGQFELKDMAREIPGLANSFATLGYQGEDGLKRLVAILQTIREDTGDASSAATQAQNIFGKMFSEETANKFKKFGVDLRSEMQAAAKSGEDAVSAFVRLSKEAIKGDLSKLPLLFSDQEFRLGMQSLITSEDSLRKFLELMNSAEVNGTVGRDVQRIMSDTQASIDRAWNSWDRLQTAFGKSIAPPATAAMDALTTSMDYSSAQKAALEKQGKGFWSSDQWLLPLKEYSASLGNSDARKELDKLALAGGYTDPEFLKRMRQGPMRPEYEGPQRPEFPGGDRHLNPRNLPRTDVPIPSNRPAGPVQGLTHPSPPRIGATPQIANMGQPDANFFRVPSKSEWQDALKIDIGTDELKSGGEEAGRSIADGGRQGADAIKESSGFFKVAGVDVAAAISSAADKLVSAAAAFNRTMAASTGAGAPGRPAVNADTGRSMPPQRPGGGGW